MNIRQAAELILAELEAGNGDMPLEFAPVHMGMRYRVESVSKSEYHRDDDDRLVAGEALVLRGFSDDDGLIR